MGKRKNNKNINKILLTLIAVIIVGIAGYLNIEDEQHTNKPINENKISYTTSFDLTSVPAFTNEPYVVLNENKPNFSEEDFSKETFEEYRPLDYLGRCGVAFAKVGKETMPKELENLTKNTKFLTLDNKENINNSVQNKQLE